MHSLPAALAPMAAYRQWIVYTIVPSRTRPGKTDKFPVDFRTGRVANAHDSTIWTDAQTAIAAAAHFNAQGGQHPFGVGFVLTAADPFWFLDIDGAHDGADWSPLAKALCAAFPGAAIEVSSSGRGLHILGTGQAPAHRTKPRDTSLGLEFYTSGRFVALTGTNATGSAATDCAHLLPSLVEQFFKPDAATGAPVEWTEGPCEGWRGPVDDEQLIARAMRSQSARASFGGGASFADLWTGNLDVLARAYPPDGNNSAAYNGSSADSALAQHLAFWTGRDCARIERLMRQSALVREKWEREDYLPRTILAVCARQVDVLTDKEPEPLHHPHVPPPEGERRAVPRPEPVTGATFLSIDEQLDLFKGCVYIMDINRVLVPGGMLLDQQRFRVMYGGYTFPMDAANERTSRDAWEAFTQHQAFRCPRADTSCFKPDHEPGDILRDAGRTRANTWWPVEVPRQVGDPGPFLAHMAKLLPDERDRLIVLSYMAACVQHKGYKFQWAPVIQGTEGNGKTLLSRCVAEAVGRRYVHWPKASKLSKEFNAWMIGKLFYAVEDIYVPDGKRDVMEDLKPMITGGDGFEIEGKGVDQISADICGNFMFNSNKKDAILKHRNDRRYAMFFTAQQSAADLARDGMTGGYMQGIYGWLKDGGGYAVVAELLHTFPIPDEFNPARGCQVAPTTSSTEEAIVASRGSIEQEVIEAIEQDLPGFSGGWVSTIMLDRLLERLGRARQLSHSRRRELLESLGYELHRGLRDGRVDNVVMPDAGKPRLYVKSGSPAAYLVGPSQIAAAYSRAQEAKVAA